MRPHIAAPLCLALLLGPLAPGCERTESLVAWAAGPSVDTGGFSSDRAFDDLRALTEIGPRVAGSEGAARARAYIEGELDKLGLEVEREEVSVTFSPDSPPLELTSLIATVPGESEDLFVLAAPYDTRPFEAFDFVGANDGGSGAALLLELARVLSGHRLPYTTLFVFLDGEAIRGGGDSDTPRLERLGSSGLAHRWATEGVLRRIRLLVLFNQVCDPDLRVARDLRSHRMYREEFWGAAARLQHEDAFPPGQPFESPSASHLSFLNRGLRPVVAIVDTSFGGDEPPGSYANTEDDDLEHCSPQSLEIVGVVTLETLGRLAQRLERIDRFADAPSVEPSGAGEVEADASSGGGAEAASEEPGAAGEADAEAAPDPTGPEGADPDAAAAGAERENGETQ